MMNAGNLHGAITWWIKHCIFKKLHSLAHQFVQEKKTTNVENKTSLKQFSILHQILVLIAADNEVNAVRELFDLSAFQTKQIRIIF